MAVRKTRGPGKIPREDATLVQGICTPAENDTTSEPRGRNALPGSPVKAAMSDGFGRNQGGTVEYICIPPLTSQGEGFFLFPKRQRYKIKNTRYKISSKLGYLVSHISYLISHTPEVLL